MESTYFITANTANKRPILQSSRMAELLVKTIYGYRAEGKFLIHEFVVMPDHLHLLLTTSANVPLERAVQLVKGGFSFRAKRDIEFCGEVWQSGYHDRRVRDISEYGAFRTYIQQNPVKRGLVSSPELFPWSSVSGNFELDDLPQRLKPLTEKDPATRA